MNIFLLTQPDAFYIPKLFDKFMVAKPRNARIVGAAVLSGEIASKNVPAYLRLMGLRGTLINGFEFARHKLLNVVDRVAAMDGSYSVEGSLRAQSIPVHNPDNVNDPGFLQLLSDLETDLVISIACPQIVRKELLELPPKGVINIHGALLPKYRGKLPSFWVLAHGERKTGVTVHYMNEQLDDGPIIVQREVPISADDTLHSLVLKSKVGYGASALAVAVERIMNDEVEVQDNDKEQATYFSFPTDDAISQFRKRGRKIR